jgi:predicted MFS family arabinose efflux permease
MISLITAANPIAKIFFGSIYSIFAKHFHFDLEAMFFSLILICFAYLGFGFSTSVMHIFVVQIIIGASDAIRVPTENYLLSQSTNTDKCKYHFTLKSIGSDIAVVASLLSGGFIVTNFGFSSLFYIMSAMTLIPTLAMGYKLYDNRGSKEEVGKFQIS